MSQQLINRNPELKRLRDEGYNVRCIGTFLIVDDVSYVAADRTVKRGRLVTGLQPISGDQITGVETHIMHFAGEYPCDAQGRELHHLRHNGATQHLPDLRTDYSFSSMPSESPGQKRQYRDYYEKVITYVRMLSNPAISIDPSADPRTFPPYETSEDESVFCYHDTASSRAGIGAITAKLEGQRVAIIGLGGTGSYILDLVAKTPVKEIHLFDDDEFQNHNAFRAPGAASFGEVAARLKKVDHFSQTYARFRRGIIPHAERIDVSNVDLLQSMDFVFLAIDSGTAKRVILTKLEELGTPFIDVGMGLHVTDDQMVHGALRVATSTPEKRDHIQARNRIPLSEMAGPDIYATNIQVADLNCLNACLAVIKWKKLSGFYKDLDEEHFCLYTVDGNHLMNEDKTCPESTN
ncbi:MAG: ThiF family adenylyltransferase [Verrucomicrobia bacterium]|nr:MAG: ThiF family adenylyltransferase [Verrucomicrobiota bacterium]